MHVKNYLIIIKTVIRAGAMKTRCCHYVNVMKSLIILQLLRIIIINIYFTQVFTFTTLLYIHTLTDCIHFRTLHGARNEPQSPQNKLRYCF